MQFIKIENFWFQGNPDMCHNQLKLTCGNINGTKAWIDASHNQFDVGDIKCNKGIRM